MLRGPQQEPESGRRTIAPIVLSEVNKQIWAQPAKAEAGGWGGGRKIKY